MDGGKCDKKNILVSLFRARNKLSWSCYFAYSFIIFAASARTPILTKIVLYLTNREALTVLCSVVKRAGCG